MRKILMICMVGGLLFMASGTAIAVSPMDAAQDGAGYLVSLQISGTGDPAEDGGWSWENATGAGASNIAGATGIGLVRYYNAVGGSAYLNSAKAAGDFISNTTYDNGEVRYATADPYFDW